jgi:hypothetical protein
MKKTLFVFLLTGLTYSFSFGQTIDPLSRQNSSANVSDPLYRYKKDFEFVNEDIFLHEPQILNKVNLKRIDSIREEANDLVFFDRDLGIEILVYSRQKAFENGSVISQPINR